jgi:hypothetical protein
MLIIGLIALGSLIVGIHSRYQFETQQQASGKWQRELKSMRDGEEQRNKQHARKEAELENERRAFQSAHDKARSAFEAERQEFERQQKLYAIVARGAQLKQEPPTQQEWEQLSKAVRAELFRGSANSREVAVQYFLDPNTSGAFVFNWEIVLDQPYPPTLVVLRNGKEIRRESGSFKGRFGARLLSRNGRSKFIFKLFDGDRAFSDPLLIELAAPPFSAWTETPKLPEKKSKDDWIAENVAWLKKTGRWPADEKDQMELMAKIEAEAMNKFGEAS